MPFKKIKSSFQKSLKNNSFK